MTIFLEEGGLGMAHLRVTFFHVSKFIWKMCFFFCFLLFFQKNLCLWLWRALFCHSSEACQNRSPLKGWRRQRAASGSESGSWQRSRGSPASPHRAGRTGAITAPPSRDVANECWRTTLPAAGWPFLCKRNFSTWIASAWQRTVPVSLPNVQNRMAAVSTLWHWTLEDRTGIREPPPGMIDRQWPGQTEYAEVMTTAHDTVKAERIPSSVIWQLWCNLEF